jgi:hypothetical protein
MMSAEPCCVPGDSIDTRWNLRFLAPHDIDIRATQAAVSVPELETDTARAAYLLRILADAKRGADPRTILERLARAGVVGKTEVVLRSGHATLTFDNGVGISPFALARRLRYPGDGQLDLAASIPGLLLVPSLAPPTIVGQQVDWEAVARATKDTVPDNFVRDVPPAMSSLLDGAQNATWLGAQIGDYIPFVSAVAEGRDPTMVRYGLYGRGPFAMDELEVEVVNVTGEADTD